VQVRRADLLGHHLVSGHHVHSSHRGLDQHFREPFRQEDVYPLRAECAAHQGSASTKQSDPPPGASAPTTPNTSPTCRKTRSSSRDLRRSCSRRADEPATLGSELFVLAAGRLDSVIVDEVRGASQASNRLGMPL